MSFQYFVYQILIQNPCYWKWLIQSVLYLSFSRPLLRSLKALNVYQINLYQHLAFTYKLNKNKVPLTFNELIKKPFHKYPTKFSENCFSLKAISLKSTKYCISFRGPKIWNKFLKKEEKEF